MSNGIVAERVFNVARIFSGICAVNFLNEQRSFGQLSQSVAWLENGASYFPCHFRCRYADSKAGQFDILFVGSCEFVVERCDLCRYWKLTGSLILGNCTSNSQF